MKRTITLITFLAVMVSLNAQTVTMEQRTLLTKRTATWCPNCGTWGWTYMKDIIADNSEKAVIVGAHYSGDLQSSAANELVGIFGGSGQPVFFADNSNLRVSRNNTAAKRTEAKNLVDANFATMPVANAGMEIFDRSGDLDIDLRVEFFEATSGTYNVGILILEDNVVNFQASVGSSAVHPYVIRESVNGVVGDEVATGSIPAGTVKDFSYSITPDSEWDLDNVSFTAIIWKENGGGQDFVNVFEEDEIQLSTSSSDVSGGFDFEVKPSILKNQSTISFDLTQSSRVNLKVYDLLGNEVHQPLSRVLPGGTHEIGLSRNLFSGKGMYLVTMEVEGKIFTKRILVE